MSIFFFFSISLISFTSIRIYIIYTYLPARSVVQFVYNNIVFADDIPPCKIRVRCAPGTERSRRKGNSDHRRIRRTVVCSVTKDRNAIFPVGGRLSPYIDWGVVRCVGRRRAGKCGCVISIARCAGETFPQQRRFSARRRCGQLVGGGGALRFSRPIELCLFRQFVKCIVKERRQLWASP